MESVVEAVERVYAAKLLEMHPARLPHALESIEALPWRGGGGEGTPAARAAVELALLDAYSRHFGRPISDAVGWMGFNDFGPPGSVRTIRHSGVLSAGGVRSVMGTLRQLWWYGIRDFKVKVGDAGEQERLAAVASYLNRPLAAQRRPRWRPQPAIRLL